MNLRPRTARIVFTLGQTAWNSGAQALVNAIRNPGPARLQRAALGAGAMAGGAVLASVATRRKGRP